MLTLYSQRFGVEAHNNAYPMYINIVLMVHFDYPKKQGWKQIDSLQSKIIENEFLFIPQLNQKRIKTTEFTKNRGAGGNCKFISHLCFLITKPKADITRMGFRITGIYATNIIPLLQVSNIVS